MADFLVYCSYCGRRRIDGVWVPALPAPSGALVSHGICEPCYEALMKTLDKEEEGK
jgi:hypothetical protein